MNMVTCTKSKRPEGIRRALVLAVFSVFVCGALAGTADAKGRRGGGHHHAVHREVRGNRGWTGGYYGAPPVVYGGYYPDYYPPPVVYGSPGIGLNINIH